MGFFKSRCQVFGKLLTVGLIHFKTTTKLIDRKTGYRKNYWQFTLIPQTQLLIVVII